MGEKLKNIYLKIFSDKRALLFSLGLVLFLALIPLSAAHASFWDGLINVIAGVVDIAASTIAGLVKLLAGALMRAMLEMIRFFMDIPVSPGNDRTPEVIKNGWDLSRNLVNIFFILILAFIGLATILRLQSYQIKKTLPSLIIIALLVNFSGVLVGFIVDMGNLITNFFLSAAANESWNWGPGDIPVLSSFFGGSASLGQHIVEIIYYSIAVLIYFTTIFVFGLRVLTLWTLVILAPLAFGAYILPSTKKFWSQWLQQLIQWSIIGIPISFTLYVAGLVMSWGKDKESMTAWWETMSTSQSGLMNLAAPLTALFLLFIGIALSMQMAPAGARGAINFGKKTGIGAMGRAGKRAWQATRDKIPEETRKSMERMAIKENPAWGKGKKGLGGFFQKQAAGVAGYARRTTGGIAKSAVVGGEQADADKAKAKASKQDVISNMKDLRQASSVAQKTAIMDAMRQKGQIKDALNPDVVGKDNLLKQGEVEGIYKKAHQTRNDDLVEGLERAFLGEEWKDEKGNTFYTDVQETEKDENGNIKKDASGNIIYKTDGNGNPVYKKRMFSDMFAGITNEMTKNSYDVNDRTGLPAGTYTGGNGKEVVISKNRASGLNRKDIEEKGYASFAEKVVAEAKTADEIKALQKGWWNNEDLMNAAHKFWGGSQTGQAATAFGRDFINKLEAAKKDASWYFELEEKKDSKGNISYAPRNMAMVRYEASSAAAGLGLAPKEGAENTEQINSMTRLSNAWAPYVSKANLQNQYKMLQAILEDRNELEIMRWIPGTEQGQNNIRERISLNRENLLEEMTQFLGQYPELKTVIAQTEKFLGRGQWSGGSQQSQSGGRQGPQGGHQPPKKSGGPISPPPSSPGPGASRQTSNKTAPKTEDAFESIILPLDSVVRWAKKRNLESLLIDEKNLNLLVEKAKEIHRDRITDQRAKGKSGKLSWLATIDTAYRRLQEENSFPEQENP